VADESAGTAIGNGAVVGVDVGDNVAGDEIFEVPGRDGTGIHGTVVKRFGIGEDDDHFGGAEGEGAFDGLRDMYFVTPLFGADGISVQGVDDGVAAGSVLRVAGREEDEDVAVNGVAFEIAFDGSGVDFDVLEGDGFGVGDDGRDVGLDLGSETGGV
jgi:hypothetical protein